VTDPDERATVEWSLNDSIAKLADGGTVKLDEGGEVVLEVTVTRRYDSFRYRQELAYETVGKGGEGGGGEGGVRVITPPYTELCYSHERCGGEAAYTGEEVTTEVVAGALGEVP
jgi:hypothetical protein